ncbi:MAG: creatininase family protein [Alphaproteobacteria bacterium]
MPETHDPTRHPGFRRYWAEMSARTFSELDCSRLVALLPVGAVEQHGPHLPVGVDTFLNDGIVSHMVGRLAPQSPLVVLPTLPIGKSDEHLAFAGTLTLDSETLRQVWTAIGEGVARTGVRRLILFNSHGGQPQVAEIVARDLRVRFGMLVVVASTYGLRQSTGEMFGQAERDHGIHGGAVETWVMLHLQPDQVDTAHVQDFTSAAAALAASNRHLRFEGRVSVGWMAQDLNPLGAMGDARLADGEKGRRLIDETARALAELVDETARFPLEMLRNKAAWPVADTD